MNFLFVQFFERTALVLPGWPITKPIQEQRCCVVSAVKKQQFWILMMSQKRLKDKFYRTASCAELYHLVKTGVALRAQSRQFRQAKLFAKIISVNIWISSAFFYRLDWRQCVETNAVDLTQRLVYKGASFFQWWYLTQPRGSTYNNISALGEDQHQIN